MLCSVVALQPRSNHNGLKSLNFFFEPGSQEIEVRRKAFIRKWRLKHRAVADSWRRQGNACSPSIDYRQANGAAYARRMRSNDCTRNSSGGSRLKLFCHPPTPPRCCSGRCSLQDRSTCARLMVGRRSPQSPSISVPQNASPATKSAWPDFFTLLATSVRGPQSIS
jgi:hypothetical protein